jgi:hypothetical protein
MGLHLRLSKAQKPCNRDIGVAQGSMYLTGYKTPGKNHQMSIRKLARVLPFFGKNPSASFPQRDFGDGSSNQ